MRYANVGLGRLTPMSRNDLWTAAWHLKWSARSLREMNTDRDGNWSAETKEQCDEMIEEYEELLDLARKLLRMARATAPEFRT